MDRLYVSNLSYYVALLKNDGQGNYRSAGEWLEKAPAEVLPYLAIEVHTKQRRTDGAILVTSFLLGSRFPRELKQKATQVDPETYEVSGWKFSIGTATRYLRSGGMRCSIKEY